LRTTRPPASRSCRPPLSSRPRSTPASERASPPSRSWSCRHRCRSATPRSRFASRSRPPRRGGGSSRSIPVPRKRVPSGRGTPRASSPRRLRRHPGP
jgi:hypothetical protein